jgi:hypothetical protein
VRKAYATRRPASLASRQRAFAFDAGDLLQRLSEPTRLDNPNVGDLDVQHELLGAIHVALKDARLRGLSRERIVDRMNQALPELAKKPITIRQLNCWTALSKEYHEMPARFVPAFCWATSCDLPLRVLNGAIGMDMVDAREVAAKELGETQIQIARLRRVAGALTKSLGAEP